MVASIIILFVLIALVIAALLFFTIGLYTIVEKAQKDITALNAIYDGLEKVDAQQYADIGTLGNRLTAIENKFVKCGAESEAKPKAEPEKKAATKSKSKKQE